MILFYHYTAFLSMGKKHILSIFFPFKLLVRGCKETPWFWATTKSCELILRSNRWILARALVGQICWAMSPWNGSFMKDPLRIKLALILIIRNWSNCTTFFSLSHVLLVNLIEGEFRVHLSQWIHQMCWLDFSELWMKTTQNKQLS